MMIKFFVINYNKIKSTSYTLILPSSNNPMNSLKMTIFASNYLIFP